MIPRERLGVDYLLNLVLNKEHNLTPSNYAYHNLHLRHLLMQSQGTLGMFINVKDFKYAIINLPFNRCKQISFY